MFEPTLDVLRLIGIPSCVNGVGVPTFTPEHLYAASINKVSLFYLKSLLKFGKIGADNVELETLKVVHNKICNLSVFLADIFDSYAVSYSIIKTLRPFPYVGSDVDVLLEKREDFSRILKKLRELEFVKVGPPDLFTTTLVREDFGVNVDLQLEITVSSLPYINKKLLLQYVERREINGCFVKTLNSCADVVVIACHALYKEHMYTLADFYTVALSVTRENAKYLCEIAERTKSTVAVRALLIWTQRIAQFAFGATLDGINKALAILDHNSLSYMLNNEVLDPPTKIPLLNVLFSLAYKIYEDNHTRSSLINALYESFSQKQLDVLLGHFSRESY